MGSITASHLAAIAGSPPAPESRLLLMQSESRQPTHCFVVSLGVNPKIEIVSELKLSLNKSAVSNVCLFLDKLETKQLHF